MEDPEDADCCGELDRVFICGVTGGGCCWAGRLGWAEAVRAGMPRWLEARDLVHANRVLSALWSLWLALGLLAVTMALMWQLTTIVIALIPPLWHRLMTPKVLAWDRDFATPEERELARQANARSGIAALERAAAG